MRKSFSKILFLSLLSLSACSMKSTRTAKTEEPKQESGVAEKSHPNAASPAAVATEHNAPTTPTTEKTTAPSAKTAPAHHEELKGVDPEKSLGWLKNGNVRYTKGRLRKDGQSPKDIERLSKGQAPHAIVLSCSDSRVPPEIVFDQKLGEIFVVRNAGEIPDEASIASIEYAVEHLGSRLIVVMGHTSCGAVKAALGTLDGSDAGSPALNALVNDIHPRLASFKGRKPAANVEAESWANAKGVTKDLLERSQILRERVTSGQLIIKTALYYLEDGKVDFAP